MAQVTVTIDGKAYRMACEEGQEQHLEQLAARFDRYVGHLKSQFGEIGDLRLTVMASIMIMDELMENERKVGTLETEVQGLRQSHDLAASKTARSEEELAGALGEISSQMEMLAARLTGAAPGTH
jgi:cell division protein ZapA